jgi:WhiB family transcriptional regulator, redox-sensing transcriptional regulator
MKRLPNVPAPQPNSHRIKAAPASERNWRPLAACQSADPELFFPISSTGKSLEQAAEAKAVCARCLVRRQCLAFALRTRQVYGIWGGLTEDERTQQVHDRKAADRNAISFQPESARGCLALCRGLPPLTRRQAADFDELQAERLGLGQRAVQGGLVDQHAGQHGVAVFRLRLESGKRRADRLAQAAADSDLVPLRPGLTLAGHHRRPPRKSPPRGQAAVAQVISLMMTLPSSRSPLPS